MKISWFVGFIMFLPFIQKAQSPPVGAISGEVQKIFKVPFSNFLLEEEGSFYVIGVDNSAFEANYGNKNIHLFKYNSLSFSLQEDYVIEPIEYLGHKTHLEKAYSNENGFHLLYVCSINKEGKKYLLHQKLSKGGKVGELRLIAEMSDVKNISAKFQFHFSENNSAALIYEEVYEEGQMIRLPVLTMCDQDFKVIWKTTASTPFPNKIFAPIQLEVSNSGEFFILGFAKERGVKNYKACVTTDYGVIRIAGNQSPKTYLLEKMDKTIHCASIKPDFNGELLLTGFYSDAKDETVTGSFFGLVNQKTMVERELKTERLTVDVFKEFKGDLESGMEKNYPKILFGETSPFKGLEFFTYQDFLPQPDGGVIAIAERRYNTLESPKFAVGDVYNYTDEILIASYGGDGRLEWLTSVPKRQALYPVSKSYSLHNGTDGIYLVFNDHPDNLERRSTGEDLKLHGGASLTNPNAIIAAHVSANGEVTYQELADHNDKNQWISTPYTLSTNAENMLTLTMNRMYSKYSFTQYKFP